MILFRSDNNVNGHISDESKRYRRRRTITNIQITTICWSFEFVGGLIAFILRYLMPSLPNGATKAIITFLSIFIDFIIIPSFYLLNTDVCKTNITTNGWCNSFKICCHFSSSTPIEEFNLEEQNRRRNIPRQMKISTICSLEDQQ